MIGLANWQKYFLRIFTPENLSIFLSNTLFLLSFLSILGFQNVAMHFSGNPLIFIFFII